MTAGAVLVLDDAGDVASAPGALAGALEELRVATEALRRAYSGPRADDRRRAEIARVAASLDGALRELFTSTRLLVLIGLLELMRSYSDSERPEALR